MPEHIWAPSIIPDFYKPVVEATFLLPVQRNLLMLKYKQIPNRGGNGDLKKTDTLWRLKLRLKFTFHSQASTTFHGHCKMLKIIICTLYIYLNAGKIELLNFMTSVCRCSAIAA